MSRFAVLALCSAACGRSQGVADQDLPGLVVEARKVSAPIDVDRATKDPAELGRALARPYRVMLAALGPHSVAVNSATTVAEAGTQVSELSDHVQIENGDDGAYHAIYTNSADYGSSHILRYSLQGEYLNEVGKPGQGDGEFQTPHGLWVLGKVTIRHA